MARRKLDKMHKDKNDSMLLQRCGHSDVIVVQNLMPLYLADSVSLQRGVEVCHLRFQRNHSILATPFDRFCIRNE